MKNKNKKRTYTIEEQRAYWIGVGWSIGINVEYTRIAINDIRSQPENILNSFNSGALNNQYKMSKRIKNQIKSS